MRDAFTSVEGVSRGRGGTRTRLGHGVYCGCWRWSTDGWRKG
jgi:hypothetical protein